MGYDTNFEGSISVDPPLNLEEVNFLEKFAQSRRMDREKGPYYVDGKGFMGQEDEPDVRDFNRPPEGQPGLWCQWVPEYRTTDEDGEVNGATTIGWDGGEKFYSAGEWMEYIIKHFIGEDPVAKRTDPEKFAFLQGHKCTGEIIAYGDDPEDIWKIVVEDNEVTILEGTVTFN